MADPHGPPPEPELASGTRVGDHYQVVGRVGAGGFGRVYRAEHLRLRHHVAIKLLEASRVPEEMRERFGQEALFGAHVRSPHLVDVTDAGRLPDGTPYLVMELLNGPDLARLVDRSLLTADTLVDLGIQLTAGLAVLHSHDILHRDVKPHNVVLQRDAAGFVTAKLVDFGISTTTGATAGASEPGRIFGTVRYIAPEILRGEPCDGRSDLYSLGTTLYEAACGEAPFSGSTVSEQIEQTLAGQPTPLSERAPRLPAPLCALIDRMLARDPSTRPGSAIELRDRLEEVRDELGLERGREAWKPHLDDILRASDQTSAKRARPTPRLSGTDPFSTTMLVSPTFRWLGPIALALLVAVSVVLSASLLMDPSSTTSAPEKGLTLSPVE